MPCRKHQLFPSRRSKQANQTMPTLTPSRHPKWNRQSWRSSTSARQSASRRQRMTPRHPCSILFKIWCPDRYVVRSHRSTRAFLRCLRYRPVFASGQSRQDLAECRRWYSSRLYKEGNAYVFGSQRLSYRERVFVCICCSCWKHSSRSTR